MLTQILAIGGMVGGIVTPTESAIAAARYALILRMLMFHTGRARDLEPVFNTVRHASLALSVIGAAGLMAVLQGMRDVAIDLIPIPLILLLTIIFPEILLLLTKMRMLGGIPPRKVMMFLGVAIFCGYGKKQSYAARKSASRLRRPDRPPK